MDSSSDADDLPSRMLGALETYVRATPLRVEAEQQARSAYEERLNALRSLEQRLIGEAESRHNGALAAVQAEHERAKPLLDAIDYAEAAAERLLKSAGPADPIEAESSVDGPKLSTGPDEDAGLGHIEAYHREVQAAYRKLGDQVFSLAQASLDAGRLQEARRIAAALLAEGPGTDRPIQGFIAEIDCRVAEIALEAGDWDAARHRLEFPVSVSYSRALPLLRRSYTGAASAAIRQEDWGTARAALDAWRQQGGASDHGATDLACHVYVQLVRKQLEATNNLESAGHLYGEFRVRHSNQSQGDELGSALITLGESWLQEGSLEWARRVGKLLESNGTPAIQTAGRDLQSRVFCRAAEVALEAGEWEKVRSYLGFSFSTDQTREQATRLLRESYLRPINAAVQKASWEDAQLLVDASIDKVGANDAELNTIRQTVYHTLATQYHAAHDWERVYQTWHRLYERGRVARNLNVLAFEALTAQGDAAHASNNWSDLKAIETKMQLIIQNHQPHGWMESLSVPTRWIVPPWHRGKLQVIKELKVEAKSLSFSPDGRHLALLEYKEIIILETEGWREVQRFKLPKIDTAHEWTSWGGSMYYRIIRYTSKVTICVMATWQGKEFDDYRLELLMDGAVLGPERPVHLRRRKIMDLHPPDEFFYGPWRAKKELGTHHIKEQFWSNREDQLGLKLKYESYNDRNGRENISNEHGFRYFDSAGRECVTFLPADSVAFCPQKALVAVSDGWPTNNRVRIHAWR